MMLPVVLHKRIYVILTIIVTFPMLIWGIVDGLNTEKSMLKEKEIELAIIAATLKERVPYSFEEILKLKNAQYALQEEKRGILAGYLQPIVDHVSLNYPGFRLGFYSLDLNTLAIAPYDPNLIGKKTKRGGQIIHDAGVYQLVYLDRSMTSNQEPIVGIRSYIYEKGQIAGTLWASYSAADVKIETRLRHLRNLSLILMCWLGMLATIWWLFRRLDKSLVTLVAKIKTGDDNPEKLNEFPQLIPVLKDLIILREKSRQDYLQKEKTSEEMAKLDRLDLVSQMAAGLAHEMRNPLQVVMGFIQFSIPKAEETMKIRLTLIMDELKRMNQLITDFLSIARNKIVHKELLQLNNIITTVYPLIYPEIVKNAQTITLDLERELPLIYIDKSEIIQLVLNISRNSIEAMGKGHLSIKTSSHSGKVQLIIADSGCGIATEQLDKIFDPFFTSKEAGTGLGLAVCKGIVDRHNGSIDVRSQVGVGTTFIVSFNIPD